MRHDDPANHFSGPRRLGRARLIAIALLVAAAGALTLARPAEAGNYVVTECSSVTPFAEASWERSSDHYRSRALCGTDSGLQAYHDASSSGLWQFGAWVWRAPAGTVFTSVQANASLTYQAGHRGELVVTRPDGELVGFGSEHNDFRVHSISGEFTQFHSWLRCSAPGAGQPCGAAGGDSAHAYVRGVYLRTDDRAAPLLAITGGSLLGSEVVRGTRGLTFAASDVGSGVRKVYVEGNGALLVTDIRNCAVADGFATALSPCPAATTESAAVPTASSAFVTGPNNTVTACVEDLALDGAANRVCEPRQIWVDNACPASAVAGGTAVSAGFADGSAAMTMVASDQRAVVRGQVAGAGAGATVCALTRVLIDGEPIVVGATALTAADGSYAIELPAGPNREVYVHYVVGDEVVARHGLAVLSSARPALDVRPNHGVHNHDRLYFAGTLAGPSCFDRVVKVQARLGKHRWQVFRTDRADQGCAFTARYKLRATSRSAKRYRFRALVPQQAGYPYERGYSRTVKVKLRRKP
jgi:hypothetical protein